MKKVLLALLALLLIAAVAFGVRTFGARNQTDKVKSSDAAKVVHDSSNTTDTTETPTDPGGGSDQVDPGDRPDPGTYAYAGAGSDSVSTLGGSTHTYPGEIGAVVQLDAKDDCAWTMDFVFVKQHLEHRSYCTSGGVLTDRGFTRTIEFFNQTERNTFDCKDDAIRLKTDAKPKDTWTWTCHNGDATTSKYTLTFLGTETLTIGNEPVKTWHSRVASVQTGDTRGTDVTEAWTAATGLPVKFSSKLDVQTKSVIGDTNYKEHATYQLTSLVPTTDS